MNWGNKVSCLFWNVLNFFNNGVGGCTSTFASPFPSLLAGVLAIPGERRLWLPLIPTGVWEQHPSDPNADFLQVVLEETVLGVTTFGLDFLGDFHCGCIVIGSKCWYHDCYSIIRLMCFLFQFCYVMWLLYVQCCCWYQCAHWQFFLILRFKDSERWTQQFPSKLWFNKCICHHLFLPSLHLERILICSEKWNFASFYFWHLLIK